MHSSIHKMTIGLISIAFVSVLLIGKLSAQDESAKPVTYEVTKYTVVWRNTPNGSVLQDVRNYDTHADAQEKANIREAKREFGVKVHFDAKVIKVKILKTVYPERKNDRADPDDNLPRKNPNLKADESEKENPNEEAAPNDDTEPSLNLDIKKTREIPNEVDIDLDQYKDPPIKGGIWFPWKEKREKEIKKAEERNQTQFKEMEAYLESSISLFEQGLKQSKPTGILEALDEIGYEMEKEANDIEERSKKIDKAEGLLTGAERKQVELVRKKEKAEQMRMAEAKRKRDTDERMRLAEAKRKREADQRERMRIAEAKRMREADAAKRKAVTLADFVEGSWSLKYKRSDGRNEWLNLEVDNTRAEHNCDFYYAGGRISRVRGRGTMVLTNKRIALDGESLGDETIKFRGTLEGNRINGTFTVDGRVLFQGLSDEWEKNESDK